MTDASIVFITSLTRKPPGQVVYHAPARSWNFTDCGLVTWHQEGWPDVKGDWRPDMVSCRRDTADAIGRPCRRCIW